MPGVIGNPLTAITANIYFDGQKVGQLQEATVEENYNVKPIEQIGSNYPVEFLPGTYSGRIIASRALLEGDLFFDKLTPGLTSSEALGRAVTDMIGDGNIEIDSAIEVAEGINDFWNTVFLGKTPRDRFNFVVYFDVELVNADNVAFAKYNNCCITARTLSVTLSNVVVLQNITALFKNRSV